MNEWFLVLGTHKRLLIRAFIKKAFNLACWGNSASRSTPSIYSGLVKLLLYHPINHLPQHVYSNPFGANSWLFFCHLCYLTAHPGVLVKPKGWLFLVAMDVHVSNGLGVYSNEIVLLKHQLAVENSFSQDYSNLCALLEGSSAYKTEV